MTNPPDSGWASEPTDPNAQITPFTPERVQSILDSRNKHPYSFLSLFYANPAKTYTAVITKNLDSFQTQVLRSRPIRDDEIAALTDHWGTSANVALSSKPAAMVVALFLAWRGRGRFRFPFWQPKWVNTSPDVFPTLSQPLLSGQAARLAWHTGRLLTYGALCNWLVTPFFLSYAGVRATVSISSDPRLQEAIKESVKDLQTQKRINHMQRRTGKVPTQFPPHEQGGQAEKGVGGNAGTGGWGDQDDASPQSGGYQQGDAQRWDAQRWDAPPQTSQTPTPQRQAPPAPSTSENAAWGDDPILDEIDDASPVAPTAQDTQKRPQRQPRRQPPPPSDDGVSAWDRLREQAQSDRNDDSKR